jgi:hypothetical protein
MKALKTGLVLAAVALIAACASSPTVSSDYNPGTNFAQFHTFGFMATDQVMDPMVDSRIKSAITAALTSKGWSLNDQNPDIEVVSHVQLSEQTQLNTWNTGWGYGRWGGWGGGQTQTTVEKIPIGTVIIDLVDTKQKQMVWRGTASNTISQSSTPEQKQAAINQAMMDLFKNFPPGMAPAK